MVYPFESSKRKLARAREHIGDLSARIEGFFKINPYARIIEPDSEHLGEFICKIKLVQPMPPVLNEITGDAVGNLRSVLDHAMFGISVASGCSDPRSAYFPFSGTGSDLENRMNGRCKDVPREIYPLLRGFQPYPGGNDLLVALNDLCNADKHRMLTPVGIGALRRKFSIKGNAPGTFFRAPLRHAWDSTKQEMILFTFGGSFAELDYQFDFELFIAFHEVERIRGQEALGVLNGLAGEVERVLSALEAETRRLFPTAFC